MLTSLQTNKLLVKAHLGIHSNIYDNFSQVYKARHKDGKEFFALKRIKMDNEKEGVRIFLY